MYTSLTKTKKYSELETHVALKRVAAANAILKHYKRYLITVKGCAVCLYAFLKANLVIKYIDSFNTSVSMQTL